MIQSRVMLGYLGDGREILVVQSGVESREFGQDVGDRGAGSDRFKGSKIQRNARLGSSTRYLLDMVDCSE